MKINPVKTIILITSTLFITSIYFNCPARATSWQKTTPAYLRGNWEEFPKHGHAEFLTIKNIIFMPEPPNQMSTLTRY